MSIDCRSEEGVTQGLVDAVISIAHVLSTRDLTPVPVAEALLDLRSDPDVLRLLAGGHMEKEATPNG